MRHTIGEALASTCFLMDPPSPLPCRPLLRVVPPSPRGVHVFPLVADPTQCQQVPGRFSPDGPVMQVVKLQARLAAL